MLFDNPEAVVRFLLTLHYPPQAIEECLLSRFGDMRTPEARELVRRLGREQQLREADSTATISRNEQAVRAEHDLDESTWRHV